MVLTKIHQVRTISPKEIKKHRKELLSLARWVGELFGYKLVKNVPDGIVSIKSPMSEEALKKLTSPLKHRTRRTWQEIFQTKALSFRAYSPDRYQERLEGQKNQINN